MADWIIGGRPPMDMWESDCRRVMPQGDEDYLRNRIGEALKRSYAMHCPYYQYEIGRDVRRSPYHDRLVEIGACFGEVAGWERPNWYAPEGVEAKYEYSYGRQNWFPYTEAEHLAVRTGVGFYDLTSLAKFLVSIANSAFSSRVAGVDVPAVAGLKPFYDPTAQRMRS